MTFHFDLMFFLYNNYNVSFRIRLVTHTLLVLLGLGTSGYDEHDTIIRDDERRFNTNTIKEYTLK